MFAHRVIAGIVAASVALACAPAFAQRMHHGVAKSQPRIQTGAPAKKVVKQKKPGPPTRPEFTEREQGLAQIPGMPDARLHADNVADFERALPPTEGPWLVLSSGGEDGAFGAGFMKGWSASGQRPAFSVVTGISTGALMAAYVFAGPKYDKDLGESYTSVTAADIFELGTTPESLTDSWPLGDLIAKRVTPQLLADIAAEHKKGRRLFVTTTSLDTGGIVVWNIGAIAVRDGEKAAKLVRDILRASSAMPGLFPPVYIEVEAEGRKFREMHVDGGVNGPLFFGPEAYLDPRQNRRIPATAIFAILNGRTSPGFYPPPRSTAAILGRSFSVALMKGARLQLAMAREATQRHGIAFNLAMVDGGFDRVSTALFDKDYMKALYYYGVARGEKGDRFTNAPPRAPAAN